MSSTSSIDFGLLTRLLLQFLGAVWLLYVFTKIINYAWLWLLPGHSITWYRRPKSWALITGASAGIGLGCAQELAICGFNVILIGHKADELKAARQLILGESPNIEVKTITLDVIKATRAKIEKTVDSLSDLTISVLINNVGGVVAAEQPPIKYFTEFTGDEIDANVNFNARFMTQLMNVMIPILDKNGPSLMLNLSSGSKLGFPQIAIYSATKAYVYAISNALGREAKARGLKVDVMAIVPGEVKTQGNHALPSNTISGQGYGKLMIKYAPRAASKGIMELSPYWLHSLQLLILHMLPEWLVQKLATDDVEARLKAFAKAGKAE